MKIAPPADRFLPALRRAGFVALFATLLAGCGGSGSGGSNSPLLPSPTFTSTPVAAAEQGVQYSYQVQAGVPSGAPVSLQLTTAPAGAALNGNIVTWTPAPDQSRVSNNFTVTASIAGAASATQSWVVTPTGTVVVNFIDTYWTSSGSVNVPNDFSANNSFPQALVPQQDGSLSVLNGAGTSAGIFAIPGVPAGHYWLAIGPAALFWTGASTFDFGGDLVGSPVQALNSLESTIFTGTFTGLNPIQTGGWFGFVTDLHSFDLDTPSSGEAGATTFDLSESIGTNIDLTQVKTVFLSEYEPATLGSLPSLVMGPELTLPNATFNNGGTNNLTDTLNASPRSSIDLNIQGSAWIGATANSAPTAPTPFGSSLVLSAQPFVTDRNASPMNTFLGPNLPLITVQPPVSGPSVNISCNQFDSGSLFIGFTPPFDQPAIVTDEDFGPIQYGDPFPAAWPRVFNFCQGFTEQVAIPGSSSIQSFLLQNGQISQPPASPVAPLLSPVQNPQINGASFFTPATLNTGTITLSWDPPTTGQPFGYYIEEFTPGTFNGTTQFVLITRLGVAVTSITLPPLPTGKTFLFMISAVADGAADMESSPRRSALPVAFADVLSAPITISSSATSSAVHEQRSYGTQGLSPYGQPSAAPVCPDPLVPASSQGCPTVRVVRH